MLRRVAFLGAEVPQLKNLKDIPMPVKNSERGYWQRVEVGHGRCVAKFCEATRKAEGLGSHPAAKAVIKNRRMFWPAAS